MEKGQKVQFMKICFLAASKFEIAFGNDTSAPSLN